MIGYPTGFDATGNGFRARAADYHRDYDLAARENGRQHGQLVSFGLPGPMRDPQWDAMFQAMQEQGVTKAGDDSVGAEKGMWAQSPGPAQTFDPRFQSTAVRPSNQIGSRTAAINGFQQANPVLPSHENFMRQWGRTP